MRENEIIQLFERIKMHYNTFTYDTNKITEWHRFLKEYYFKDVLDNLDRFILEYHDRPPLVFELTKGIERIPRDHILEEKNIQCDLCRKIITYYEWDEFEKHHRRCEKIDFIDRQSKKIRGEGIDKIKYYNMSDNDLDTRYRKIMDNWVETHPDIAITPETLGNVNNLFKKMEDVEDE